MSPHELLLQAQLYHSLALRYESRGEDKEAEAARTIAASLLSLMELITRGEHA